MHQETFHISCQNEAWRQLNTNAAPCFAPTLATPLSTSSCREKILQPRTFSHACPIAQGLASISQILGEHLCGTIALMEFVLKTRCQKLSILVNLVSLPPYPVLPKLFPSLGEWFFRTIALMEIVPKNPCRHARPALPSRSLQQLPPGPSHFHASQCSSGTRPALLSRSPRSKVT